MCSVLALCQPPFVLTFLLLPPPQPAPKAVLEPEWLAESWSLELAHVPIARLASAAPLTVAAVGVRVLALDFALRYSQERALVVR
jgi:hypothetical protein